MHRARIGSDGRDQSGRVTGHRFSRVAVLANRGQSSIDFVIGFGIFFLTFSFVVLLIPDLLAPFGGQEGPAVADRAVETLASDLLATGITGTLNETCTVEFFAGDGDTCFDAGSSTASLLGLSAEHTLNVTLERNVDGDGGTEVVCYDGDGGEILACSDAAVDLGSDSDVALARGRAPPGDTQSVRTARRVVRVDGETYFLRLRTW